MKSHKFLRTGWKKSYKVTKGQQKYNLKIDTIEKGRLDPERERSKESQREKICIKMRGEKRKKGGRKREREREKNEEKKKNERKNEIRESEGNDFKKLKILIKKYIYIYFTKL